MYDVIVIGGGTSGMMASVQAAMSGAKVLLLEKNSSLGRKLLLTGGGRCNVTNNRPSDDIIRHIPGNGRFLYSAFSQFDNYDIMAFFRENGVSLKEEDHGRMFPTTDKARTILETFVRLLDKYHVDIWTNATVKKLIVVDGKVQGVRLANQPDVRGRSVVIAVGGQSIPKTGSTGDGYVWAKSIGHTITPLFATEVPLTSDEPFIQQKTLQGLSLRNIALSVLNAKGKPVVTHEMDMIFTHFGISGPAVLRCSSFVYKEQTKTNQKLVTMQLDVMPQQSTAQLTQQLLQHQKQNGDKTVKTILKGLIPERLALFFCDQLGLSDMTPIKTLPPIDLEKLVTLLKQWHFTVNGSLPIEKSFVTGGGISVKEVDPKTMASKFLPNVYFCGECLDIHGYTGGYNITAAFVTGTIAGRSAANTSPF